MATVHIPPQMRDLTRGAVDVAVQGTTLRQVIRELDEQFTGLAQRLTVDGRIAPGLAVSIDGVVSSRGLLARVESNSEIHFLPAIGGG
jgi:molybdopterin synthase sulfur carrier subunit